MAYQHSQLARECSAVTTPSARLVLMVLASAMDTKTHLCFWTYGCLLHYTKLSRSTLAKALAEIEQAGIIVRRHRMNRSNVYIWKPGVAEALRDQYKPRKESSQPLTVNVDGEELDADIYMEQVSVHAAKTREECEIPRTYYRGEVFEVEGEI